MRPASQLALGLLLVAALLRPAPARAGGPAPPSSSLGWVRLAGAEACVGGRALAEAVEKHLGRQVFVAPTRADAAVEGRIEPAGPSGGWRATITLSDAGGAVRGTRELRSDETDCRAFDGALVLALALMIDPDAEPPPPAPRPPPVPAPAPPCPRCDPAPVSPPPPPPRTWSAGAQAGLAVGFGLLPRPAAGVTMRVHLVPPRGPAFELGGTVWIAQGPQGSGPGGVYDLAYGSLAVCPLAITASRTTFFACGGFQAGAIRVAGVGLDRASTQARPVFDLTAEAHARRRLAGPLFAAVGLGLLVPTVRDLFYAFDPNARIFDLFRMSPIAGTAEAALGLALP